jgi:hypothetical protein
MVSSPQSSSLFVEDRALSATQTDQLQSHKTKTHLLQLRLLKDNTGVGRGSNHDRSQGRGRSGLVAACVIEIKDLD